MAPHNLRVCALLCTFLLLMTDTFGVTGGTATSNLAVKSNGTATRHGTATNLTTNSVVNGSMVVRITEENSTNSSTPKFKPNWSIYGKKINLKISIKTPNHMKCWEKCESKKKCKFITWIKKKKKCILFSSYKGGKEKKNCISGPFPTSSSAPPSLAPFNGMGIGNISTNANESMILIPRTIEIDGECLTSPGYPNNYPNYYYKRHDFSVTGQAIEITFRDFDVENENTCYYDRLSLYIGYSGASVTLPHGLCGNSLPPKFTIPTSSAILIFQTDGSVTKKGFRLCYKAVDRCVTSPGYPNIYDNNEDYKHSFSLATSEPMEITFHSFDVEAHRTCSYDRLEFYDGNGHLVKSLCGSSLPQKFTIPTSSADIRFITDRSVTKKGFKFCFKEKADYCDEILCSGSSGCNLEKNHLLTTLPKLNKEFLVSFEYYARQYMNSVQNVIQFTEGGHCCEVGQRIPGFWINYSGKNFGLVDVRFAVNGDGNYGKIGNSYPMMKWNSVKISQSSENGRYIYRVAINGDKLIEVQNWQPKTFSNVKVYAGNPWDRYLWGGSLRNLLINTDSSNGCEGCKCGVKKKGTRIINGADAQEFDWPWMARLSAIYEKGSKRYGRNCGGSLIADQWILTAAHCIPSGEEKLKEMVVFLGDHDRTVPDTNEKEFQVSSSDIIIHAGYTFPSNDIALLKLSEKVDTTRYTPVCLPEAGSTYVGEMADVYGWGKTSTDPSQSPDILQETSIEVITNQACTRQGYGDITEKNICAYTEGTTACQGDSGGPLTYNDNGAHKQIGIASYVAKGCPTVGAAVVFVRVSEYLDWIKTETTKYGGAVYCDE